MPSGWVCAPLILGLPPLAWLFPISWVVDVLATGNHCVLDVASGAVLLIVAIAVATGWARFVERRSAPRAVG